MLRMTKMSWGLDTFCMSVCNRMVNSIVLNLLGLFDQSYPSYAGLILAIRYHGLKLFNYIQSSGWKWKSLIILHNDWSQAGPPVPRTACQPIKKHPGELPGERIVACYAAGELWFLVLTQAWPTIAATQYWHRITTHWEMKEKKITEPAGLFESSPMKFNPCLQALTKADNPLEKRTRHRMPMHEMIMRTLTIFQNPLVQEYLYRENFE